MTSEYDNAQWEERFFLNGEPGGISPIDSHSGGGDDKHIFGFKNVVRKVRRFRSIVDDPQWGMCSTRYEDFEEILP
jgi:hypothetical protein